MNEKLKEIQSVLRKVVSSLVAKIGSLRFSMLPPRARLFVYYSLGICVFAGAAVYTFRNAQIAPSFPMLAPGMYVGIVEIPDRPKLSKVTLYIQRGSKDSEQTPELTTVLFVPGWQPQILALTPLNEDPAPLVRYAPISFSFDGSTFELSGSAASKEFRGIITENGAMRGTWFLRPLSKAEYKEEPPVLDDAWLQKKALHQLRVEEQRELTEENNELSVQVATLEAKRSQLPSLQESRASVEREAQTVLEELRQEQETYANRVSDLIRELNQLERITDIGKAVSQARRVTVREEKWYSVNWSNAQSNQAEEQMVAEEMGINIRSLARELDEANEVQSLKSQIKEEQAKIRALKAEYKRKIEGPKTPPPRQEAPQPGKRKDPPWWKRWDTVFGTRTIAGENKASEAK